MEVRDPHGTGAAVDPIAPRLERGKVENQPMPPTAVADPLADGRDPKTKRVKTREAAQALARLPRRRDVLPKSLAVAKDFEPFYRQRLELRDKRRGELLIIGRGVMSHGVGARLDRATWLFAASAYASAKAAKSGDVALFSTAASLAAQADRLDWSAYHLAVREAQARAANEKPRIDLWEEDDEPDTKESKS